MSVDSLVREDAALAEPVLELEMQELEAMEAPGFWTGAKVGALFSGAVAVSVAAT